MMSHHLLRTFILVILLGLNSFSMAYAAPTCEKSWPAWNVFKKAFIHPDGRVIDGSTEDLRTTSEGQAYALFFALVADDRATFERLINWTEQNLAGGNLATQLPAWLWGKRDDGSFGILDENSASDADLWMAYALGEAGRLWGNRRYVALSSLLANSILTLETTQTAKLGTVLLPGRNGFIPATTTQLRLNPSYVPLQLLRWFTLRSKDPRWNSLLTSSRQVIISASPKGYAPDWVVYNSNDGFSPDREYGKESIGSYDAIRVYLWAGMIDRDDASRGMLLNALKPMARFIARQGQPPMSIDVSTGVAGNTGSSGFSAAVIPFLQAAGETSAVNEQLQRIETLPIAEDNYYDQVLSLFALGWRDNLYHFDSKGNLTPRWMSTCQ